MSVRVDFYLTDTEQKDNILLFACRLVEKAYLRSHRVFIHCEDESQAFLLDDYLWSFKPESFIPHNLLGEGPEPPPAVQIGFDREPRGFDDVLLNFHSEIPAFYGKFQRIIEVVGADETQKELARKKFKQYRQAGCDIKTHQIETQSFSLT